MKILLRNIKKVDDVNRNKINERIEKFVEFSCPII